MQFKFQTKEDKEKFLIEEKLRDHTTSLRLSLGDKESPPLVLRREKLKTRLRDYRKSRLAKKSWRVNRHKLQKGVTKFHGSTRGKQFHRKLTRRLLTRDFSEKEHLVETLAAIQSLKVHLTLGESYSSSVDEEVEYSLLREAVTPTIIDIESKLDKCLKSNLPFRLTDEEYQLLCDLVLNKSPQGKINMGEKNTPNSSLEAISDIWESTSELDFSESAEDSNGKKLVDGEYIIGRVVGECFFPGQSSRNKRYYSNELWEGTLKSSKTKSRMAERMMYGTVGHNQAIDENAILEGKVSHVVNNLWINESGNGVGEFLILNTPSGRNLRTILKAGSKLKFSTRAQGKYLPEERDGNKVVDPKSFMFETVDFVIDPGFLNASPSIVEQLEEEENKAVIRCLDVTKPLLEQLNTIEESKMGDQNYTNEFVEHLKSELSDVKEERNDLIKQVGSMETEIEEAVKGKTTLSSELESLKEENKNISSELSDLKSKNEKVSKYVELEKSPEEIKESLSNLDEWTKLGELDKVKGALATIDEDQNKDLAELVEANGSMEVVKSKVQLANSLIEEFGEDVDVESIKSTTESYSELVEKVGEPLEVESALTKTKEFFEKYGTPESVSEALEASGEFFETVGTKSELEEAISKLELIAKEFGPVESIKTALESFDELILECGTPSEIKDALLLSSQALAAAKEEGTKTKAEGLAKTLGADYKDVRDLLDKDFSEERITEMLSKVSKSEVSGADYLMGGKRSLNENSDDSESNSRAAQLMG